MANEMTQDQYNKLKSMLEVYKIQLKEAKTRAEFARRDGDLKENESYSSAKREIADYSSLIQDTEEKLNNATIVEFSIDFKDDTVKHGSKVRLEYDSKIISKVLTGPDEGDYDATITTESVLGKALIGRRAGDTFTYIDNIGFSHTVKVLRVV